MAQNNQPNRPNQPNQPGRMPPSQQITAGQGAKKSNTWLVIIIILIIIILLGIFLRGGASDEALDVDENGLPMEEGANGEEPTMEEETDDSITTGGGASVGTSSGGTTRVVRPVSGGVAPAAPAISPFTTVQVYYPNSRLSAGSTNCEAVFPLTRTVARTPAIAKAALNALLVGPTAAERVAGYTTGINAGTYLKDVKIIEGAALADFSAGLDQDVAGSCRVQSIRAQITRTLKQFPSVHNVSISVDGNFEEALQP